MNRDGINQADVQPVGKSSYLPKTHSFMLLTEFKPIKSSNVLCADPHLALDTNYTS